MRSRTRLARDRGQPPVDRILVATDRSDTADRAVQWAAEMAKRYDSELLLLQVLDDASDDACSEATSGLAKLSDRLAAPRIRTQVVVDSDPSRAIAKGVSQAVQANASSATTETPRSVSPGCRRLSSASSRGLGTRSGRPCE